MPDNELCTCGHWRDEHGPDDACDVADCDCVSFDADA